MADIRVPNRLTNKEISIFYGVVAGFAYKLQMPVFWVRFITAVLFITAPYLIILYLLFAFHMDEDKNMTKQEFEDHINSYQNKKI